MEKWKDISGYEQKYQVSDDSITKAAHSLNVNKANIVSCCKHKLNTCGGYGWRYE